MIERIEEFFRDLFACLQIARLYTTGHVQFEKAIDKAYEGLTSILNEREELIIGIIGEEFAFEKEILFDLSKVLKPVIVYLKEREVERIAFYRGVEKRELTSFVEFLALKKDEVKKDSQEYLVSHGIKNINVGKIETSKSLKPELSKALDQQQLYADSSRSINLSLESLLSKESVNYMNLRMSLKNIMDRLIGEHQELLALVTIKRYDISTFIHSLNVAILSMHFSSKLGIAKDDCMAIGMAAIFHDLGKLYISRKIIKKPDKLTEEEFSKIRSHVTLGAELLLEHVDNLGVLPVVVALEHHLGFDANGYPKLPYIKKPHKASLIVSICDVYDALSQRRNYKNDYPPLLIYEIMMKGKGTSFDPELLDAYFKIMGVWPVGSIVSLSDSRIAVVREEDEEDIFSPCVEVIYPLEKKESIKLKETKPSLKIEHYLNPWKEGQAYLALIQKEKNL
ncbi:MAG: HD domain-containing protein [Candidatus Omnitrophica bacterium]|nr:HD domain-containing protein [Candidatus Omnitrophota bacterium]MDD5653201.1 HD domain-containing protein [Candidatus Omnitrophota bacterium]